MLIWEFGNSLLRCTTEKWHATFCTRSIIFSVLSIVTFLMVCFVIWRTITITKKKLSYQVGVLLVAFGHSLVNIVMYVFISRLEVSLLVEFTKSLVLLAIGFFFASSAVRMLGWKNAKYVGFPVAIVVFITLVGCLSWSYEYNHTHKQECSDVPLLIASLIHLSLSWTFATVSAYLVFLLRNSANDMMRMSSEYKARHKKPMATLACVYAFSGTVNAVTRVYLIAVSANTHCDFAFNLHDPTWLWVATFYRIIDIFVPLWTLLWYFVHTVKSHVTKEAIDVANVFCHAKAGMGMDVSNVLEFSDHIETDVEGGALPPPQGGIQHARKFVPHQSFAANSPYKTYNVSRANTSSSDSEPNVYTEYSAEEPKTDLSSMSMGK